MRWVRVYYGDVVSFTAGRLPSRLRFRQHLGARLAWGWFYYVAAFLEENGLMPASPLLILGDQPTSGSFQPLGSNVNALMVWPRFPPSFWGFEGVLEMLPECAMTPPLGLITVAALCPASWTLRLLDHAFDDIRGEDYRWADLVMVSSMHAQRMDTQAVLARARSFG